MRSLYNQLIRQAFSPTPTTLGRKNIIGSNFLHMYINTSHQLLVLPRIVRISTCLFTAIHVLVQACGTPLYLQVIYIVF